MSTVQIKFRLEAPDRSLEAAVDLPREPLRPVDLLPVLLSLADAVVSMSESHAIESGETISCREGCAACCRQLVPVSEPEAVHLASLVQAMPEPKRSEVKERFREARRLAEPVLAVNPRDLGAAAWPYFALQIACPFLENERCSIHDQRPSICREYLVVSPAIHCADLDAEKVRRVPVPVTVSSALMHFGDGIGTAHPGAVPLIDALEYAATEFAASSPEPIPAPELFQNFMRQFQTKTP
jgi:Fe-S-cluster containining protein